MLPRHFSWTTENEPLTTFNEHESIQLAAGLSPEELEHVIIYEWSRLQQVPSYIERLLETNRGLIEGTSTQN